MSPGILGAPRNRSEPLPGPANRSLWSRLSVGAVSFRAVTEGSGLRAHDNSPKSGLQRLTNFRHRRPIHRTPMGTANQEFLKGTLDMLILKTLSRGPNHGYGIALHIRRLSLDAFRVGEGSLYPALQRLLVNGWVRAEWGVTETGRKARTYH